MKYMKRRGLRMFAVAALLPMMAIAQSNAQTKPVTGSARRHKPAGHAISARLSGQRAQKRSQGFPGILRDDVIYTRATGLTVAKADILRNIDVRATERAADYI